MGLLDTACRLELTSYSLLAMASRLELASYDLRRRLAGYGSQVWASRLIQVVSLITSRLLDAPSSFSNPLVVGRGK